MSASVIRLWTDADQRREIHRWVYFLGLLVVVMGMPLSVFMMSFGQFIILGNWLLEGRYRNKWNRFISNRPALYFCSIYLLYLLALLYSTDWAQGLHRLQVKLPIFGLCFLVVSSGPLPAGSKKWLLMGFAASITALSMYSLFLWQGGDQIDPRELSPFISHIRVSLMTALSVVLLFWLGHNVFAQRLPWRILCFAMAGWLLCYLFLLQSLSGLLAFGAVLVYGLLRVMIRKGNPSRCWASAGLGVLILLPLLTMFFLHRNLSQVQTYETGTPQSHSALGAPYLHDFQAEERENGYLVFMYIAERELEAAWNARSEKCFGGEDAQGQLLRFTLYRYMASRGLRKDAAGMAELTDEEIRAVERGIPNKHYLQWPGLLVRLHQSLWELREYRRSGYIERHSLAQRVAFWKAAWASIGKKPLFGWGTGDVHLAMRHGFEATGFSLEVRGWMRAHNQYLSFLQVFGLVGFAWLVFAFTYASQRLKAFSFPPFNAFLIILLVSMLNEDTLGTQAGLTFFVFFSLYFLFLEESGVSRPLPVQPGPLPTGS